ncbi:prenyltransferase/squalene oxidase repeat-containing protein [Paenibacillus sp. JX-17]|uniref:Prenyltransferase/squalene oxidase repeat-containing protein n=1 Tax=Paenibacillus lacisoli TaxID=3064525 RepID=A0ABT9C9G0_9BACL|nr:prenyltransferase/squalene oxidase repeat-containing protein [Paenibacillus sp. JX-17]MDO7905899.1 prenyltransferase/squalene oxidase repeat-containing protein [Paenibacillus sp. JX-17]
MTLTPSSKARATDFIYRHARLLDRLRYEYHFEGRSANDVIAALRAYQNEDGGFGHGLEPDIRAPFSQPVTTEFAFGIMDEIQRLDEDMLRAAGRYLGSIAAEDGGFPRALDSLNTYPHAPWWEVTASGSGSLNPTGTILGLLYKWEDSHSLMKEPWFESAASFVWSRLPHTDRNDYHDLINAITFLVHAPERPETAAMLDMIDGWLEQPGVIETDPNKEGYAHKVLDWAPHPDSYASKYISAELLEQHLAWLTATQLEDGGWPISWEAPSIAAELEWRGSLTVSRLLTLRSYGWL